MNLTATGLESDQKSCNRSTTTAGGGIASKMINNISKILQSSSLETDEEDIGDLMVLIDDLNTHTDLTVKLKSQSKILTFLQEASADK